MSSRWLATMVSSLIAAVGLASAAPAHVDTGPVGGENPFATGVLSSPTVFRTVSQLASVDDSTGLMRARGATSSSHAMSSADLRRECRRYAPQGVDAAECVRQARIARKATAKYRDFTAALADGFVPITGCEQTTLGAMGQHWARVDRMAIDGVDARAPEILLYVPRGSGFVLLGVEYEESASVGGLPYYGTVPPDTTTVSSPPVMFGGRRFDGPMQGHIAVQPWHYDLHVWLWERNPAGLFAQYNPNVSC